MQLNQRVRSLAARLRCYERAKLPSAAVALVGLLLFVQSVRSEPAPGGQDVTASLKQTIDDVLSVLTNGIGRDYAGLVELAAAAAEKTL